MALAMMVPTRFWLTSAVSGQRDLAFITQLVAQVRAIVLCRPLLLAVDGLASYVTAFQAAFRNTLPRWPGEQGRPRLIAWSNLAIVQGGQALIQRLIQLSQGTRMINTAFIECINATFRQRLAHLTHRTRNLARQAETLLSGMYVEDCLYNFCDCHKNLRLAFPSVVLGITGCHARQQLRLD